MAVPVVVFVYARPKHTQLTLEALENNRMAGDTEVYIFSDAAKNEQAKANVEDVRAYLDKLQEVHAFKQLNIIKAPANMGLAKSVISGVGEVIEKHGKAIVLEDDLITTPDFLDFMNGALEKYETDSGIWSVSGYSFRMEYPKDFDDDVFVTYRGCSWGWATWKDRWDKVDWEVRDYDQFKSNKLLRARFKRGGEDLPFMLDAQMSHKADSWAVRWCYSQSKLDMLTVYPVKSRVKNIGLDGTGTHNNPLTPFFNKRFEPDMVKSTNPCQFIQPKIDSRITKMFNSRYGREWFILLKSKIKNIIVRKK